MIKDEGEAKSEGIELHNFIWKQALQIISTGNSIEMNV